MRERRQKPGFFQGKGEGACVAGPRATYEKPNFRAVAARSRKTSTVSSTPAPSTVGDAVIDESTTLQVPNASVTTADATGPPEPPGERVRMR